MGVEQPVFGANAVRVEADALIDARAAEREGLLEVVQIVAFQATDHPIRAVAVRSPGEQGFAPLDDGSGGHLLDAVPVELIVDLAFRPAVVLVLSPLLDDRVGVLGRGGDPVADHVGDDLAHGRRRVLVITHELACAVA